MLLRIAVLLWLGLFFCTGSAFAITVAEYRSMLDSSPDFRAADRELSLVWKNLQANVFGHEKKQTQQDQQEFLKRGLDALAQFFMDRDIPKTEAYTFALQRWANILRYQLEMSQLADGPEKTALREKFTREMGFYKNVILKDSRIYPDNCGQIVAQKPVGNDFYQLKVDSNGSISHYYYRRNYDRNRDCLLMSDPFVCLELKSEFVREIRQPDGDTVKKTYRIVESCHYGDQAK